MAACAQSLKKVAWTAVGLSERLKEKLGEFEAQGEESQSLEARRLRQLFDSIEKRERKLSQKVSGLKEAFCDRLQLLRRADIERLDQKISDLADHLRRWEDANKQKT